MPVLCDVSVEVDFTVFHPFLSPDVPVSMHKVMFQLRSFLLLMFNVPSVPLSRCTSVHA